MIQCNHRDYRHRLSNRSCLLEVRGEAIVLNANGQCEMREPKDGRKPKLEEGPCVACGTHAASWCSGCNGPVCPKHRSYVQGIDEHRQYCPECLGREVGRLLEG